MTTVGLWFLVVIWCGPDFMKQLLLLNMIVQNLSMTDLLSSSIHHHGHLFHLVAYYILIFVSNIFV